MAVAGVVAVAGEAPDGAAERGPPANSERHFVDPSHRRAVARPAAALWSDEKSVEPVLPLAPGRDLAAHPVRPASPGGTAWRDRLGPRLRGRQHRSNTSARWRCVL